MAILKFIGTVSTNKVGSDCEFTFEVYEASLPKGKQARQDYLDAEALNAMWESGQVEWSYRPAEES
jgi:hypothetical protein